MNFFCEMTFPVSEMVESNKLVYIEQPLNIISFLVKVPVLSLKIYLTLPNCSIND